MGVVYKLIDTITQYIIDEKSKTPSLSCRKLSSLIKEKFEIEVSKSSVNSILKNASLSNAVGRPIGYKSPKTKFKIPETKKKQLLEQIKQTGIISPVLKVESPPEALAPMVPPKEKIIPA